MRSCCLLENRGGFGSQYKCSNMINVLMFSNPINEPWLMSFIYGPPK